MKRLALFLALAISAAEAATVVDHYRFTGFFYVPRTYDNMASLGYRKYQRQRLDGEMTITYDTEENERPVVAFTGLTNRTHKINGCPITYSCTVGLSVFPRVNVIGNNKTGVFRTGAVNFDLDAEPSYSIGEDDEDNSLILTLAGRGYVGSVDGVQVMKRITGNASGTLGCGCKAYGHTSPTRVMGCRGATCLVDDVAAAWGNWTARWKYRVLK